MIISALDLAIPSTLLGFIQGTPETGMTSVLVKIGPVEMGGSQVFVAATPTDAVINATCSMPLWIHMAVLVFFVAGVVILVLMMAYEVYSIRHEA